MPSTRATFSQRLIWPIIDKEWRGRVILNEIVVDKEKVFSSIYNPSTSSSVLLPQGLDAAMRKALCVFGVSWVCNTLRQAPASPQRCLQMQINFPHTLQPQTNSEDKLLARNATTFCSSICWRRRRRMLCFWRKKYLLFVRLLYCWKFCSHQFEVRGRGEMLALAFSESSLQINLRSSAAPPAAHSSYEWEFKGSHFNN